MRLREYLAIRDASQCIDQQCRVLRDLRFTLPNDRPMNVQEIDRIRVTVGNAIE